MPKFLAVPDAIGEKLFVLDVDSVLASIMYLQLKIRKNIGRLSTIMLSGFKITTNPPLHSGMQNQDQV